MSLVAHLGDVFEFVRNGKNIKQDKREYGLPITRIETISNWSIDGSRVGYANLTEEGNEQWLLKDGDLLFSHINSVEHIGKCALFEGEPKKLIHGMNLLALRPKRAVLDPHYAFRALSSPIFRAKLQPFVNKAVNQASISTTNLKSLDFPLPPLDEQRRIAAILGKADALRRKRKRALDLLDSLTQSIFLEMFGHPAKNSHGLRSVELGALGGWRSGGTPSRSKPQYFVGSIPWFSSGELNNIFTSDSVEHLSELALKETSASLVSSGSLMLGMYDTAALKSSVATTDCSCNQAVAFAQIDKQLAETLYVYFAVQIGKDDYRRAQRGIRQKNLNLSLIKSITIPLPALSDQAVFVQRCASVIECRKGMEKAIEESDLLFTSLQSRAFSGQL